jgi:hypothetical protein
VYFVNGGIECNGEYICANKKKEEGKELIQVTEHLCSK